MQQGGGIVGALIPLVIMFLIFYFLVIRPQQKQVKEHKKMVEGLKKGDNIITNGGIKARVIKNEEKFLKIEIANGVEVWLDKDFVAKKVE